MQRQGRHADCSLRSALRRPRVLQHYNAELTALRTSLRARNVHRLDRIADTSKNDMARVAAVKAMEVIADQREENNAGVWRQPRPANRYHQRHGRPKVIGPARCR
jgi:hypothetical protein